MALLKLNVDFDPMVIGADTPDFCLEKRVKGHPPGVETVSRINRALKIKIDTGK
jgi:hypothetical protein